MVFLTSFNNAMSRQVSFFHWRILEVWQPQKYVFWQSGELDRHSCRHLPCVIMSEQVCVLPTMTVSTRLQLKQPGGDLQFASAKGEGGCGSSSVTFVLSSNESYCSLTALLWPIYLISLEYNHLRHLNTHGRAKSLQMFSVANILANQK